MFTNRQIKFIECYLVNGSGTQSAKDAGYSEHTAHVQANRLLKNAKVKAEIDRRQAELSRIAGVKAEDLRKFWKECMENEDMNASDRLRASENLGKDLNLFKPDQTQSIAVFQNLDNAKLSKYIDLNKSDE